MLQVGCMKSAYELAMERLAASDPQAGSGLNEADKAELQAIEQKFTAKIAEREIFLNKRLAEARAQRDREAFVQIEEQLRNERLRLNEEKEAAKEQVRKAAAARA